MKLVNKYVRVMPWFGALLVSVVLSACSGGGGGGQTPILGLNGVATGQSTTGTTSGPTVTSVAPANRASGVPLNNDIVTATFSAPVATITGAASFTLSCSSPCVGTSGVVTLDPSGTIASLTFAAGTLLTPSTVYTATVTGVKSLATGVALANPYAWSFTTGLAASVTRPAVISTVPVTINPGSTIPVNSSITATFSEDMAPATIDAANFTLSCSSPCVAPTGNVSYVVGSRTAVFSPTTALVAGSVYTATISAATTDLAGNALGGNQAPLPAASNYVWTFTTAAATPAANVSVLSTNPANNASSVCTNSAINAQFSVPSGLQMNPTKVNTATFTITGPAPTFAPVVATSVVLDAATGTIATFTPSALTAGVTYTATIMGGVNGVVDLANPANDMLANYSWNFTATSCVVPPVVALGTASTFGEFGGGAGMTNQGTETIVNGNIGTTAVSTLVTGFHDTGTDCIYTETPLNIGTVNGLIFTSAPPPTVGCPNEGTAVTAAVASAASGDALAAYNQLVAMPAGPNPGAGNLANLTLVPGDYTAASGSFMIQGGNLTLDAQGNANAIFVFQMATTLTVGGPGAAAPASIILTNGAQAKNVFWQVGSAATINEGGGGTMVGTIISQSGVSISTAGNVAIVTLNGRALSLGASVTVVNTVVNVPAP